MRSHLLIILGYFSIIAGCSTGIKEGEESLNVRTPVTTVGVTLSPMVETIDLNAVSSFLKKSTIRSTATGMVESVDVDLGMSVRKGSLLFTIKTKEATALERNTLTDTSFNFKGIIKIKSFKDGIMSSITHYRGDYVQEGDELAIISEQSSIVFLLQVPFEMRNFIRTGDKCDIVLSDKQVIRGEISANLPIMDMQSQTENFVVKPYTNAGLPENLIAKIKIVKVSKPHATVLPKEAVLTNEVQTDYWVMKLINDSVAVKVPVKKGIESSEKVEILEPAFKNTDRIVLTGNYGMADTALITIQK